MPFSVLGFVIGQQLATREGVTEPNRQNFYGLLGGVLGSSAVGLATTVVLARQEGDSAGSTSGNGGTGQTQGKRPQVTTDPQNESAASGKQATFQASATGDPPPEVKWEEQHGKEWRTIHPDSESFTVFEWPSNDPTRPTATALLVTADPRRPTRTFKAQFRNGVGDPVDTRTATLTLEPEAVATAAAGSGGGKAGGAGTGAAAGTGSGS